MLISLLYAHTLLVKFTSVENGRLFRTQFSGHTLLATTEFTTNECEEMYPCWSLYLSYNNVHSKQKWQVFACTGMSVPVRLSSENNEIVHCYWYCQWKIQWHEHLPGYFQWTVDCCACHVTGQPSYHWKAQCSRFSRLDVNFCAYVKIAHHVHRCRPLTSCIGRSAD